MVLALWLLTVMVMTLKITIFNHVPMYGCVQDRPWCQRS